MEGCVHNGLYLSAGGSGLVTLGAMAITIGTYGAKILVIGGEWKEHLDKPEAG